MFNAVTDFEKLIASWFGAPYSVATDSCTHAVELCLRLKNIKTTTCPTNTYLSIPMTLTKLDITYKWTDVTWKDFYELGNSDIIDAAVLWKKNSYISGKYMCLSFQYRKHLGLGRGGMILLDNAEDYERLIKMCYDGRERSSTWATQDISMLGYHYYMTPEVAQQGIDKFNKVKDIPPKQWSYLDYPNISNMTVFRNNNGFK